MATASAYDIRTSPQKVQFIRTQIDALLANSIRQRAAEESRKSRTTPRTVNVQSFLSCFTRDPSAQAGLHPSPTPTPCSGRTPFLDAIALRTGRHSKAGKLFPTFVVANHRIEP
jgi:hypothetical protein